MPANEPQQEETIAEPCPPAGELHRFAFGEIDTNRIETIASHLKACEDCRDILWQVDSSNDPLIQLLRDPPPVEPFIDEVECKREVKHLAGDDLGWLTDEASHPTPADSTHEIIPPQITLPVIYAMIGAGVLFAIIAAIAFWFFCQM